MAPTPPDARHTQFSLFDEHPIALDGFTLKARRAVAIDRPSKEQWAAAFQFVYAAEESSPFWIGDLWNYAHDERKEWREQLPQLLADIGLDVKIEVFYEHGSVATRVKDQRARDAAPSWSHARVVANAQLDDDDQVEMLTEAGARGWTKRDLQMEIRAKKRAAVVEGQGELEGMFRVLYVDPPWSYGDSGQITKSDAYGRAERHYPTMSIEELCELPVQAHAMPDSVLFCWVTAPLLYENPGPREVIEAWGFKPKTGIVWHKVKHNFGNYVSVRHEHLIIATRGKCLPDRQVPMIPSVQTIERGDVHSEKPADFRKIIERLYNGPYCELFGRQRVEGWTVFGNDSRLWAKEAAAS